MSAHSLPQLSPTAARCIEAYGGESTWRSASAVEATVSSGGFALRSKLRRGLRSARVRVDLASPSVSVVPADRHGNTGIFDDSDVRVETAAGDILRSRPDPRRLFPGGRRLLWWDDLDEMYFGGFALWNYLAFPALLLRDDIDWHEVQSGTLEAVFPRHLPTHCERQRFHIDMATGLLRQHDYTAEVFGNWAKAAHVVLEHETSGGVPFPSRRRVTPRRGDGTPRRLPVLVWIEVRGWRLC
jgi:hypothetical protein